VVEIDGDFMAEVAGGGGAGDAGSTAAPDTWPSDLVGDFVVETAGDFMAEFAGGNGAGGAGW
jgi:hypothetical protein